MSAGLPSSASPEAPTATLRSSPPPTRWLEPRFRASEASSEGPRDPSELQRGLRGFAGGVALASLLVPSALTVFALLGREAVLAGPWRRVGVTLGGILAVSLAVRRLCERPLTSRGVAVCGRLYFVVLCGLAGHFHSAHELHRYGAVTGLGPYIILLIFLPLVLEPDPPAILTTGTLCSVAALAGILSVPEYASSPGAIEYAPDLVFGVGGGLLFAVLIARGQSKLRRQVARARRLGSYHLEAPLGEGGMGEVWRARHRLLARPAAVKVIRPDRLDVPVLERRRILERFAREAEATATLTSVHTVRVYDFGQSDDGTFYLAMELLDGIDLRRLVALHGPLPAGRVARIVLQACESLAEAHDLGLVHRDLKPGNLMLCRQGIEVDVLKVLDFGLVTGVTGGDAGLTRAGTVIGTPAYASPEQLAGRALDGRTDLYSLGCVAYWALTGSRVFDVETAALQISAHLRDRPVEPSAHGVEIPPELERIVLACLEKDPDRRPASARQLATRIRACRCLDEWTDDDATRWWRDAALAHSSDSARRSRPVEATEPTVAAGRPDTAS